MRAIINYLFCCCFQNSQAYFSHDSFQNYFFILGFKYFFHIAIEAWVRIIIIYFVVVFKTHNQFFLIIYFKIIFQIFFHIMASKRRWGQLLFISLLFSKLTNYFFSWSISKLFSSYYSNIFHIVMEVWVMVIIIYFVVVFKTHK